MTILDLAFAVWTGARPLAPEQRTAPAPVTAARAALERLIARSGAEVSVAWQSLDAAADADDPILVNADISFHAASMMKVPVMIELYRQAAESRLRLDDPVIVTNRFHSVVDGSVYELAAADDSDRAVYDALGESVSLRALCEAMIASSSNLAANLLIEKLGAANVQATVVRLGAPGMQVLRGVEDQKAFDRGLNNTTTARALLTLFWKLGRGEAVGRTADAEMIESLKRQRLNDAMPAGLPPGTVVAHKTGSITRIHHDGGIVYGARPYALVVLTRGIEDQKVSAKLIADVARIVDGIGR